MTTAEKLMNLRRFLIMEQNRSTLTLAQMDEHSAIKREIRDLEIQLEAEAKVSEGAA